MGIIKNKLQTVYPYGNITVGVSEVKDVYRLTRISSGFD
nr:MAG TPA: hypothetical protein [Caudoviricetes sp.]